MAAALAVSHICAFARMFICVFAHIRCITHMRVRACMRVHMRVAAYVSAYAGLCVYTCICACICVYAARARICV